MNCREKLSCSQFVAKKFQSRFAETHLKSLSFPNHIAISHQLSCKSFLCYAIGMELWIQFSKSALLIGSVLLSLLSWAIYDIPYWQWQFFSLFSSAIDKRSEINQPIVGLQKLLHHCLLSQFIAEPLINTQSLQYITYYTTPK